MKHLIGIDPSISNNGLAYLVDGMIGLETLTFWKLINWFKERRSFFQEMEVHIEDPTGNRVVFNDRYYQKMKRAKILDKVRGMLKIAQNVGENKAAAKLLFKYFEDNEIKYFKHIPGKKSMTKLSAENFKEITGIQQRSSEHSRDACMLIWGRR